MQEYSKEIVMLMYDYQWKKSFDPAYSNLVSKDEDLTDEN